MRLQLTVAFAALALAACGGPETPATDGATPETAAAEPAAPAAPATPVAVMGPAIGQWEIASQMGGMTLPPAKTCIDKQISMQEAQETQAQAGLKCEGYSFNQNGTTITGNYTCTAEDGSKTTTQVTTEGDLNTAYTTTLINTREPAQPGVPNPFTITMTAKRLGDCPTTP